jgi:hypothetical protein
LLHPTALIFAQAGTLNGWTGTWTSDFKLENVTGVKGVQTPVPEPISMLLFGTGLVAAGGYVRRRMKK